MAFEPLDTDEKLASAPKRKRDFEGEMLFGCSGFLVAALGGYFLSIWPFLFVRGLEELGVLGGCLAMALVPSALLGAFAARKFGIAGAFGHIGGAIAAAVFLYLRLQQVFLAAEAHQTPTPQYPASFGWLIPLAWVALAVLVGQV